MRLVISAVNFTEGGPLAVLRAAARAAAVHFPDVETYVLVHALGTVSEPRVKEIAFPKAKRSWLSRLRLEWFGFMAFSRRLKPDVWLALHDITPRVICRRQYVYCHNPAPFCETAVAAERLDLKFLLFRRFYGLLYGCLIRRNRAVIVQQSWLRDIFRARYGVDNVIVAYPATKVEPVPARAASQPSRFLFPAFPRVFKNFEVLCEAAALLDGNPDWGGEILLTIDGSENAYAAHLHQRYSSSRSLRFIGLQAPISMSTRYAEADVMIFPSLLETWGLPLTEAISRRLPILAADLLYAREAIGTYDAVTFFNPTDSRGLASLMLSLHLGRSKFGSAVGETPAEPFAEDWQSLLTMLLVSHEGKR